MSDSESTKPAPTKARGADAIPPLFEPTEERACAKCAFRLKGLPDDGICPECGEPYTHGTAMRVHTPPRTLDAIVYLATPVAFPCGCFVLGAVSLAAADEVGGFVIIVLGFLAFGPCMIWLGRRLSAFERGLRSCLPPSVPARNWGTAATGIGCLAHVVLGAGWTAAVIALLALGACIALGLGRM